MKYSNLLALLCISALLCACRKDSQEETDAPYSDLSATYTLDDNCGTAQLFVNDPPVDGVVAYAEFDIPEIPQITRLNYVLESSWPENAAARGYYRKGQGYQLKAWDTRYAGDPGPGKDKKEWFV